MDDQTTNYTSIMYIDGEEVLFNIIFYNINHINPISLESLINLEIEENINSPFYKGILTIKNENNSFDTAKEFIVPDIDLLKYDFLESGENFIILKIQSSTIKKDYVFNIVKEFESIENNVKAKNFVLIDIQLWYMQHSRELFSTTFLQDKDPSQLSNNDRMSNTGDAIKKLIKDTVNQNSINEELWTPSKSKIFYSSNSQDTLLDTLNKILENTLDENEDNMFLLKRDNKFCLFSLKNLYKDFLKNQYDYNFGGSFTLNSDNNGPETGMTFSSFKINDYSIYNENSKNTLDSLINYKVYNYNYKDKKFNIYNEKNTIEYTKQHIENNYLNSKVFINRGENANISKNRYYNTFYSISDDQSVVENEGKQEIIKNLMNYSTALNLNSEGIYNLNVGNFIVVNNDSISYNKNVRKLNGGWFVVGYKHTFGINKFATEIACTKFYDLKRDE